MGGLDWQALPVVTEILGIEDPEVLIEQLVILRDFNRSRPPGEQ